MKNQARLPLVLASLAGFAATSHAAILVWNNPAGGLASLSTNWNPAQVPVAGDTLMFPLNSAYNLTFTGSTPASALINIHGGTVTLTTTSPHTTSFFVAGADVDVVNVTLTTGTVTAAEFSVSQAIINTAVVNVNDADAHLISTNVATIGFSGNGTLNVTNFGRFTANGLFRVARANAVGTVTVIGANLSQRSTLTLAPSASQAAFGVGGLSTTTISFGGLVTASRSIFFSPDASSTANATISGSSPVGRVEATLATTDDLHIAHNTSAAASGTATINLNGGGLITVADQTIIGDTNGSNGRLNVDGGELRTHDLIVTPTNGRIDILNGLVVIDGGIFSPADDSVIINGGSPIALPILRLDNGASLTTVNTLGLATNSGRRARLEVLDGSTVNVPTAFNMTVGEASTLVHGAGSRMDIGGGILVGESGVAELQVLSGAETMSTTISIGAQLFGQGTMTVSGVGSRATTNVLNVGGSQNTSGGTGLLQVSDQGEVVVHNLSPSIVFPNSTIRIESGSELHLDNLLELRGTLQLVNGVVAAETITGSTSGSIEASGRIDASVNFTSATQSITVSGPLQVGKASGTSTFSIRGPLSIGANSLSLIVATDPRLGDVTINGGTISMAVPNRTMTLASGDSLSGTGTINGALAISGGAPVTPTGANGLTFTGLVSPLITPSISVTGTRVRFNGTSSGFTGAGTFNCIFVTTGSTITATGPISVGNGSTGSVDFGGGTLSIGAHTFTCNSPDVIGAAALTDIRGGTLAVGSYQLFNNSIQQELRGFGLITGSLRNFEKIAPAGLGNDPTGHLHVTGPITIIGDAAILAMDIDGDFDQLSCLNNITLDGSLIVQFVNGFVPTPGDYWPIIHSTGEIIGGDFDSVTLPPNCVLLRSFDTVTVYFPCLSDTDADGDADSDDIIAFFSAWDAGNPEGDIDDDGDTDSDDIVSFFSSFDNGC